MASRKPRSARAAAAVHDMTDAQFDALLPVAARQASRIYWTSVAIARRAARILDRLGVRRVLDVGSGPGKFCMVAAARAPRISFVGIEHRPPLVTVAQSLASRLGIANVTFSVGDATRMPWTDFDAFYVFNSFAENDFAEGEQLDHTVELSRARHVGEAKRVARRLADAPAGSVLLTHQGLSGPIPGSYDLLHVEAAGTGWLRVWQRGAAATSDRFWLEEGADVSRWQSRPSEAVEEEAD
ncbi:MAG TPA: methyltransferase domain-containing protein [Labilithrix sp.]|nr:methyltransferase domain-containing protein [Labilithrix sp.]